MVHRLQGYLIISVIIKLAFIRDVFGVIDQQNAQYDENVAKTLLAMSAAAYAVLPDECISRTFPKEQKWERFSMTSESCDVLGNLCSGFMVVSESQRQLLVVFRGTRDKVQLFSEIYKSVGPKTDFHNIGKVNGYFLHGLDVLWPSIQSFLSDPKFSDFNVAFTGHSLGGALAALSAVRTVLNGLRRSDQIIHYTFGEPRVGNPEFASNFNRLVPVSFRIVNGEDIVPHVPPCSNNVMDEASKPCDPTNVNSPYHHGIEIWYPNGMTDSNYKECRGFPYGEDFSCSDKIKFSVFNSANYFDEHRHYFGHKVPAFGKLGCVVGDPREETLPNDAVTGDDWKASDSASSTSFGGILKNVKDFGQLLGLGRK